MNNDTTINAQENKVKFNLKGFLSICLILFAVMIFVGILTYIIPAGAYDIDENGKIIANSFHFLENSKPLPIYRFLSAPIEALIIGQGNMNVIQIILLLLILGGTFNVLDDTGGMISIVRIIVNKFFNRRYLSIWIITLAMMLLSSLFGLQEELLVLFPIFLLYSKAMNWSSSQAISLVLITTGVGFTVAIMNPFTIGIASELAGVNVLSAVWYRIIIFVILYVVTSLYLVYKAKKDEMANKNKANTINEFVAGDEKQRKEDKKKTIMISTLFLSVLLIIILSATVPFLEELGIGMILMAIAFIIGTFVVGSILLKSFTKMLKSFLKGVINISPSIIIILLAFSVKYIADCGNIIHTMFYYFSNVIADTSPFLTVFIMYALVLIIEFFIPGAAAKALLLIPLFTLAPLPGVSVNIILLVFLFGDGYTNILYPTCGTLLIGLSLAKISFVEWLKRTWLFQLFLFISSILFLFIAVAIGL